MVLGIELSALSMLGKQSSQDHTSVSKKLSNDGKNLALFYAEQFE
jgi:hypothetical protein